MQRHWRIGYGVMVLALSSSMSHLMARASNRVDGTAKAQQIVPAPHSAASAAASQPTVPSPAPPLPTAPLPTAPLPTAPLPMATGALQGRVSYGDTGRAAGGVEVWARRVSDAELRHQRVEQPCAFSKL